MGTSPTEPFRYSLETFPKQKTKLKMPKGAGLTKPMKLSAELADIVGKKEASRAECIKQLWAYIKKNNLQDPENKRFFNPDQKNGKGFRKRPHSCLRYGQVPLSSFVLNYWASISSYTLIHGSKQSRNKLGLCVYQKSILHPLKKKIISNLPKERHPFLMNKNKPFYTSRIYAFWCVSNYV